MLTNWPAGEKVCRRRCYTHLLDKPMVITFAATKPYAILDSHDECSCVNRSIMCSMVTHILCNRFDWLFVNYETPD